MGLRWRHCAAQRGICLPNVRCCAALAECPYCACPLPACPLACSKTFTTAETMLNARTVRAWLTGRLGQEAVAEHMVAVR